MAAQVAGVRTDRKNVGPNISAFACYVRKGKTIMTLKKKFRRFFTLTHKANEGFTLIELIIVIAIVAILGGVAVPAYSGYIEKADRAADAQLLADVNKAFAAACMVEGLDNYNAAVTAPSINQDGTLGEIAMANVADFNDVFKSFYEGGTFKKTKSLVYSLDIGGFKDPTSGESVTISYGGGTITVSGEVLQALQESTFGSVMGGEALLQEITGLTNMMGSGDSKLADDLLADTSAGGYMQKYAAYLGVENASNLTGDDLIAAVEAKLGEAYVANGIEPTDERINASLVNGMVFYAAEGMKDYTVDSAYEFLQSDNIYGNLSTTDDATRLAQASLVYGMYAGFVNSEYNTGDPANGVAKAESSTNNPMGAIQNISGSGAHSANFQDYLKSPQGKADVKAYMESMNVINNAAGNGDGAGVLVNGFSDSELETLLIQVLGK